MAKRLKLAKNPAYRSTFIGL